jgi:glycerophosphoryl diester phosphodiesterase
MSRFFSWFFHRILPWVVFAHAVLFIAFWLTNSLFYASSNDYLAGMLGYRLDYVRLLIWVSALIAVWSGARAILAILGKKHRLATLTSWLYGVVALVYIIFFYASFWLLFRESPVQLVRIGQLLGYFRLILDAVVLLGLALLGALLLRKALRKNQLAGGWRYGLLIGTLLVFAVLWALPIIFLPGSVVKGELPAKPLLIAHRGASMLAPENTIAAANLANSLGVYGLETDVQVSQDGVLFLMHDDTLDRTTDASSLFPGNQDQPASGFTWAGLSQLNAGQWFVQQDPFGAISQGLVTPDQVSEYQVQTVPRLADWLEIVRNAHVAFRFDLKQPPEGHPYQASFFELALNEVHQAGIDSQIWFLVDEQQLEMLREIAPDMIATYSANYRSLPPASALVADGYQIVNVEYGISPAWIKQYKAAGLWVDVYTVDEPWQFSRLWLLGVNSITTSNTGVMASLSRPVFSQSYSHYLLLWGLVGLAGVCLILGLVLPQLKVRAQTSERR